MIRDYFADLELSPSASLDEVKQAYKRLARRFHPDLNPGDLYAEESFKRIREAYENLRTQTRIVKIKSKLLVEEKIPVRSSHWNRESQFVGNAGDFIDEWKYKDASRAEERLDLHLMATLDPQERLQKVEVVHELVCESCRGKGGHSKSIQQTCKGCAGMGYQLIRRGAFRWKKTCEKCRGRGYEILSACASCKGYGKISKTETLHLPLPKAWDRKSAVKYEGLGNQSFDGSKRGNLWVNWIIKK